MNQFNNINYNNLNQWPQVSSHQLQFRAVVNFELNNHLGNVLVTISDKKLPNGVRWKADITSYQDYEPFGSKLIGRSSADAYRYDFNGKETDEEVGLIDYEERGYDPQICRFDRIDPECKVYLSSSPYIGLGNNPILFIDKDGRRLFLTGGNTAANQAFIQLLQDVSGLDISFDNETGEVTLQNPNQVINNVAFKTHIDLVFKSEKSITLNIVENGTKANGKPLFYDNYDTGDVDVLDMQKDFDDKENRAIIAGKVIHILTEQRLRNELKRSDYNSDHEEASAAEAEVTMGGLGVVFTANGYLDPDRSKQIKDDMLKFYLTKDLRTYTKLEPFDKHPEISIDNKCTVIGSTASGTFIIEIGMDDNTGASYMNYQDKGGGKVYDIKLK